MILYRTELNADKTPILVEEKRIEYKRTSNADQVVKMLNDVFHHGKRAEEIVYEICYAADMTPIVVFEISKGGLSSSIVDLKVVFRNALLMNASSVIIAHNHPSGSLEPSREDLNLLERLRNAGDVLSIQIADFLILTDVAYHSAM